MTQKWWALYFCLTHQCGPLQKTDGSWRMTMDCYRLNQVANLIICQTWYCAKGINKKSSSWYAAIDLNNVFFFIPLRKDQNDLYSCEIDNEINFQFCLRVMLVLSLSVIILLEKIWIPCTLTEHHTDSLHQWHDNDWTREEVTNTLKALVRHVLQRVKDKPSEDSGPATSVKVLGVQWSGTCWEMPSKAKDKLLNLAYSPTKRKAQYLVGLFVFYRQHIHHLGILTWWHERLSVLSGAQSRKGLWLNPRLQSDWSLAA